MGKFYITTPIYYVNDAPHIGNAYCTIAADAIARYQRMRGKKVLFATGVDENGMKVAEEARRRGLKPQAFVDKMSSLFADTWRQLDISHDCFIRTTSDGHRRAVQALMKRLYESGDIYEGTYEGWYCLSDETFFRESELVDGRCPNPECRKEVEWLGEKGFFFRFSRYADRLLDHINGDPDFLLPETRKNEVVSFIRGGLKDACISRLADWGTPMPQEIPGTDGMVVYVWVDALVNYLTVAGYPGDEKRFAEFWPADFHLVGKEIFVRFHATLWPAMLMAAGLPLPKTVFGHGWLTVNGEKMSKSKGNALAPSDVVEQVRAASGCRREIAVDAVRYFLLREVSFALDGDCSLKGILARFNADLANDLGNLLNRLLPLIARHTAGRIPSPAKDDEIISAGQLAVCGFEKGMESYDFSVALRAVWAYLGMLNRWIDARAPWALARKGEKEELARVLYCLADGLRIVAGLISPIMPNASTAIQQQLGLPAQAAKWQDLMEWGKLPAGAQIQPAEPLFPRVADRGR